MRLFAEAVTILSAVVASVSIPWIPESREDKWWQERHDRFKNNTLDNPNSVQVLFYGDSITKWWNSIGKEAYDKYYAPVGTVNYAITAERTEHILFRIKNGEVTSNISPSVCVLKIGTNNLEFDDDTSIAIGISLIVHELRERLPNTKILLLGILPRENEELTNRIRNINDIIKYLDNGNSVRFLDMKDHFYDGGKSFRTELYNADMLHLSPAGYNKWAELMNPLFFQMLNSTNAP